MSTVSTLVSLSGTQSPESIKNDPILSSYFFCVGKATTKANGDVMQNDNGNKYAFQLFINDLPVTKFILIDAGKESYRAFSWLPPSDIERSKRIGATSDMVGNICAGLIVAPIAAIGATEIAPLVAAATPYMVNAAKSAAVSAYFGAQSLSSNTVMLANWGQTSIASSTGFSFFTGFLYGAFGNDTKINLPPDLPIYEPFNNAAFNSGSNVGSFVWCFYNNW